MQVNIQNEESQTINSPRYRFNQSPKFINNSTSTLHKTAKITGIISILALIILKLPLSKNQNNPLIGRMTLNHGMQH